MERFEVYTYSSTVTVQASRHLIDENGYLMFYDKSDLIVAVFAKDCWTYFTVNNNGKPTNP